MISKCLNCTKVDGYYREPHVQRNSRHFYGRINTRRLPFDRLCEKSLRAESYLRSRAVTIMHEYIARKQKASVIPASRLHRSDGIYRSRDERLSGVRARQSVTSAMHPMETGFQRSRAPCRCTLNGRVCNLH